MGGYRAFGPVRPLRSLRERPVPNANLHGTPATDRAAHSAADRALDHRIATTRARAWRRSRGTAARHTPEVSQPRAPAAARSPAAGAAHGDATHPWRRQPPSCRPVMRAHSVARPLTSAPARHDGRADGRSTGRSRPSTPRASRSDI